MTTAAAAPSVTMSKVKAGATAEATWILKNWMEHNEFLVAYSSVLVRVGETLIKFYLKPLKIREVMNRNGDHIIQMNHYSLVAQVLEAGAKDLSMGTKLFLRVDTVLEPVYPDDFTEEKLDERTFLSKVVCDVGSNGKKESVDANQKQDPEELMVEKYLIYQGAETTNLEAVWDSLVEQLTLVTYSYCYEDVPELIIRLKVSLFQPEETGSVLGSSESGTSSGVFLKESDLQSFHDVMLTMSDGKSVPAHRLVLAAHSPVFRAMLTTEMLEAKTQAVNIPDLSSDAMKIVLGFVYSRKLGQTWIGFVDEVVHAASKYELLELLSLLEKQMVEKCSSKNALDLYKVAKLHGLEYAKMKIAEYINRNTAEVLTEMDPN